MKSRKGLLERIQGCKRYQPFTTKATRLSIRSAAAETPGEAPFWIRWSGAGQRRPAQDLPQVGGGADAADEPAQLPRRGVDVQPRDHLDLGLHVAGQALGLEL